MANFGQAIMSVAGAVIGWYIGGPTGAAYGFQLGLMAGSYIFPTQLPTVFGPRLEDLNTVQGRLGTPLQFIWGSVRVPAEPIYLGCVREEATSTEMGGKGGNTEQEVVTYTYYQSIAIGLCEGPIDGILRVWENGELKYDIRPQQEGESFDEYASRIEMSSEYETQFVLYYGTETQEPDPMMEAELGVGNVPGYRGYAYMMYFDRQMLDSQARRHPLFLVEVFKAGTTGRFVDYNTSIDTDVYTSWQSTHLAVDWARNRYYTVNLLEGEQGAIRVYNITDNTEIMAVPFEDIMPPGDFVGLYAQISVDEGGFIYTTQFVSGSAVASFKLDPVTFEIVGRYGWGGIEALAFVWQETCRIRQYSTFFGPIDYIMATTLTGTAHVHSGEENPANIESVFADPVSDDYVCVRGARRNFSTDQGGRTAYGYFLGINESTPNSDPIRVHRFVAYEQMFLGIPMPVHRLDQNWATIAVTDIEPTWARIVDINPPVYDEVDETIIVAVRGTEDPGSFLPTGIRWFKWDPDTLSIVWVSTPPPAVGFPASSYNTALSQLRGTHFAFPYGIGGIASITTATGEFTLYNFAPDLTNNMTGDFAYSSGLDAIVTFVIGSGPTVVYLDRRQPGVVSLADIVRDTWETCGGDEADISVEDLEERYIIGYARGRATGRGVIEPLRPLGPFDAVEEDGLLKFPTRGKPIVATLTVDQMGAHEDGGEVPPAIVCSEVQELELPRRVRVRYISQARDYEPGEAMSLTRFTKEAVSEKDVEMPAVIEDTDARQAADKVWAEAWLARWIYDVPLDISFLALSPTDCIGLPVEGRVYRARIVSTDDSAGGLLRKLRMLKDDDGIYTSVLAADPPLLTTTSLSIFSPTSLVLLDLPPLRDEDDNPGLYAATFRNNPAANWNGAAIHRSADGGTSWSVVATIPNEAVVGRLAEDLGDGITTAWDTENEIVLDLLSGSLESRTESALLENRANALAIGMHGRWEIVQFLDAVQEGVDRWRLSGLLRGRRGTEHNTGTGITGDFVVLLAGGVSRIGLQNSDIGNTLVYRPVTVGTSFSSASSIPFAGEGEPLMPFSPVHIEGERDGSNNLTVTWTRRDRFGQELSDGVDLPMSEATEEYEVDIVGGFDSPVDVLRTITGITDPDVGTTYTAAQQTTDGLTPGDPVSVRVYQVSATVGRGHAGEATV